jgi:hypothetical protein
MKNLLFKLFGAHRYKVIFSEGVTVSADKSIVHDLQRFGFTEARIIEYQWPWSKTGRVIKIHFSTSSVDANTNEATK